MVLGIKDAVNQLSPAMQKDYRDDLSTPSSPSFLPSEPFLPVKVIGAGVMRPNSKQRLLSTTIYKTAAATTYTQVATVAAGTRIFFIGAQIAGNQNDKVWIEDASTGNIAVSDASTSGLFYAQLEQVTGGTAHRTLILPAARECTQGIRVALAKSSTNEASIVVYYLEEQVNG